jgi:hypothetical protein
MQYLALAHFLYSISIAWEGCHCKLRSSLRQAPTFSLHSSFHHGVDGHLKRCPEEQGILMFAASSILYETSWLSSSTYVGHMSLDGVTAPAKEVRDWLPSSNRGLVHPASRVMAEMLQHREGNGHCQHPVVVLVQRVVQCWHKQRPNPGTLLPHCVCKYIYI